MKVRTKKCRYDTDMSMKQQTKRTLACKKRVVLSHCVLTVMVIIAASCDHEIDNSKSKANQSEFAETAINESRQPVRPGVPGKQPFWNLNSKRFIYAPAFNFATSPDTKKYRFTLTTQADSERFSFEAATPWAPLTPIWSQLPDGRLHLKVQALDHKNGKPIATVGEREFLKSTPFTGLHTKPAYPYKESGYRSLHDLLHQPKIQYWLKHRRPDPGYPLWSHPTKIMSALVIGLVHYAKYFSEAPDVQAALNIANIVVEFLLSMTEPEGKPLEYWPPTYWDGVDRGKHPYFHNEIMTNSPAIAAEMLLDLYDYTEQEKYFTAAKRIADTYVRTQRKDGTWPQIMNTETGDAVKSNKLIPTMVIELFDRFIEDYDRSEYDTPRQQAFEWCMQHVMSTFNWQAQFEDTRPQSQYKNLSREEPTEFARILFKNSENHPEYIAMAKELLRFAEDQFVVWEPSDPVLSYPWFPQSSEFNGTILPAGSDWFIPCALEQYKFYTPIARSTQLMVVAYLTAFEYTKALIYRAKATALANTLTIAQAYHGGGEIPTHLRKKLPELNWINNGVYPAVTLIKYADQLAMGMDGLK